MLGVDNTVTLPVGTAAFFVVGVVVFGFVAGGFVANCAVSDFPRGLASTTSIVCAEIFNI